MAGVNVRREGTGSPERLAVRKAPNGLLYGKRRHPVGFSLAGSACWCLFAASCRGVAVRMGHVAVPWMLQGMLWALVDYLQ